MVYTWSSSAGKASFRCQLSENDTIYENFDFYNETRPDKTYCQQNMKISISECQRCYRKVVSSVGMTQIEACKQFVFDRKYYEYTLVEEVSIQIKSMQKFFSLFINLVVNGL